MLSRDMGVTLESLKRGFEGGLEAAARLGLGYVQIAVGDKGEVTPDLDAAGRAAALKRVKDKGLGVSALVGDLPGHGLEHADEHEWRVPIHKRQMELAADMECPVLTMHIGVIPEDTTSDKFLRMREACAVIGAHGLKHGVRIAIETGPEKPETLKAFIGGVPDGSVGVNFDPANLVMVLGVDPIAAIRTLAGHIYHVHVKDGKMLKYIGAQAIYGFFAEGGIGDMRMADYFLETPIGQGDVDIARFKHTLDDIGYKGVYTIERETGADPIADIELAIRYLTSL